MQAVTVATDADMAALEQLNRDYVEAVQRCDVRRFDEILADDFLNTNPDGSLVDDFRIHRIGAVTAIRNAPSPAATASMAIAEHIIAELTPVPGTGR